MSIVPNRLIVNIRGANASGKTTLVRQFIAHSAAAGLEVRLQDSTVVRGHLLSHPALTLPIAVLGLYDASKYSGCDKIKSADQIEEAVRSLAQSDGLVDPHVIFEGFRVSKSFSRFAALRNELVKADPALTWLWALIHAPVGLIYERAAARREDGKLIDKKELAAVVKQMDGTRTKCRQAWPNDVLTLDPTQPPEAVYERFLDEMVARERGETPGAN
jgi:thymidylate kinase